VAGFAGFKRSRASAIDCLEGESFSGITPLLVSYMLHFDAAH
jgi:hypothetical protein